MKLAVLFDHFGPYHLARLRATAGHCETLGLEFHGRSRDYAWELADRANTRVETLAEATSDSSLARKQFCEKLCSSLEKFSPDVVAVPGWSSHGARTALQWCIATGTRAVLMSESSLQDETRIWLKESIKRRFVSLFSSALVGGRLHAEYLRSLGMDPNHIFTGYDVVDNYHFASGVQMNKESAPKHFLASSRFVEKKNLPMLLRAYAAYRNLAGKGAWGMTLLGDGPLRGVLQDLIIGLGLEDSVTLPGFIQYDELPGYYLKASAFVHASTTEQWGLVVNEALAAGLPVIVSNRCGCVPELVHENENGFTFDPMDQEALANCLLKMTLLSLDERASYGHASRRIVANHAPAAFGEGLMNAATTALKLPVKSAGLFDRFLLRQLLHQ